MSRWARSVTTRPRVDQLLAWKLERHVSAYTFFLACTRSLHYPQERRKQRLVVRHFLFCFMQRLPEGSLGNSQEKLQESTSTHWDSFCTQRARLKGNLQTTAKDGGRVCKVRLMNFLKCVTLDRGRYGWWYEKVLKTWWALCVKCGVRLSGLTFMSSVHYILMPHFINKLLKINI